MKRYIKPSLEVVKSETESVLAAVSLPKGQGTVKPEDALAPILNGNIFDDSDLDTDLRTEE
ncbi:MAG: hypothetical protein MJZ29_10200 [Bacteroidaceae bacterium]|nr:hypothetical protein [Bacteroidaceae bacterium]